MRLTVSAVSKLGHGLMMLDVHFLKVVGLYVFIFGVVLKRGQLSAHRSNRVVVRSFVCMLLVALEQGFKAHGFVADGSHLSGALVLVCKFLDVLGWLLLDWPLACLLLGPTSDDLCFSFILIRLPSRLVFVVFGLPI